MRKYPLLILLFLLLTSNTQAQFRNLLKKAEHKAMEKVLGENSSDSTTPQSQPASTQPPSQPEQTTSANEQHAEENQQSLPKPKPIDFPVTGETVESMHGIYQWVIDTAAFANEIANTPQGKYGFDLARQKGLKGTNEQVFQQLLNPQNKELLQEIDAQVEAKFPEKKSSEGNQTKRWQNDGWSGEAVLPSGNANPGSNPAWGGVSMPSLYFSVWGGDFSTWITNRYIKSELLPSQGGNPTIMGLMGLQAAEIVDLDKKKTYSIGSVLGVKFTQINPVETGNKDSIKFAILKSIGAAQKLYPVPGIKVEPGKPGKFGPYNTVSEKLIIPVQQFTDPTTGKPSDALLLFHDILSGRQDYGPEPIHHHYDPSYKIIYQYYFTHDLDQDLPSGFLKKYQAAGWGDKGFCVGVKIEDEKGNSADYRLTGVQPDVKIDKGQFQIPADYPVMTQAQLNEAVKKQFSLKNLFKRAMQNSESGDGK